MFGHLIGQMRAATIYPPYRPAWWRAACYYLCRVTVNPVIRRSIVSLLRVWIGRNTFTREHGHPLLDVLKEEGITRLNESLTESQCDEIAAFLSDKLVHDRRSSVKTKVSAIRPGELSFGFHAIEDVLDCPHIMEFVSSPQIIQLAAEYLGCAPTLTGIVVQWSFPSTSPAVVQQFHRDSEDWRYLRFFVYLSDVDLGCGPHVFIKGSHRDKMPLRLRFYSAEKISQQYGADSFIRVYGKRGTGVAADTCGIHKGELPTTSPRLVLSFTYSMLANPSFRYQPLDTRHPAALKNYSNRLFLRQ